MSQRNAERKALSKIQFRHNAMSQAPRCQHGEAERGVHCEKCHPKKMDTKIQTFEMSIDERTWTRLVYHDEIGKGGQILGMADVQHRQRRVASIAQVFVHRAYRKRGIGRALINGCCEVARGCRTISLVVRHTNTDACAFYRKLGFEYGHQEPGEYVMTKQLHR